MLSTPDTSHVSFENVYEPAEDSFLLLDTLSSNSEKQFLQERFAKSTPLILEVGIGSGVVLAFVAMHAKSILGKKEVVTLGIDINFFACKATQETIQRTGRGNNFLGTAMGDLTSSILPGSVDILVFNPPYVPTEGLPSLSFNSSERSTTTFDEDSELLSLSYAGGADGMETTTRLLQELKSTLNPTIGVAYILLCESNRPEIVKALVRSFGDSWAVETAGTSGKKAGWEKLQVIRIWRTKS